MSRPSKQADPPGACRGTRADGAPCRARPLEGRPFCRFHDPELAEERKRAAAMGGRALWRRLLNEGDALPAGSPTRGVLEYLADVMDQARDGTLTPDDVARLRLGVYAAATAAAVLKHADAAQIASDLAELRSTVARLESEQGRARPPWARAAGAVQ